MKSLQKKLDKSILMGTIKSVATNPIIIGIVVGMLWSILRIPIPYIMENTLKNVASTATPLGLMAMEATFDWKKAFAKMKPALTAATINCYVMAKNMGHEGTLTSSVVMLTTLFCAFTLTVWLFVKKYRVNLIDYINIYIR